MTDTGGVCVYTGSVALETDVITSLGNALPCVSQGSGVGSGHGEFCGWMLQASKFVWKSHLKVEGLLEPSPLGFHTAYHPARQRSVCLSLPPDGGSPGPGPRTP